MDIELLVLDAAARIGVEGHATTTEGPVLDVEGSAASVIHFPNAAQATHFADACMIEGVPARAYDSAVIVLHETPPEAGRG
jgi:hypothetical protein